MPTIETRSLFKSFAGTPAVAGFSHRFRDGKITTILGPSGSGKSTTLWMIAGLTAPDRGLVLVDGEDITDTPAEKRNFGVVFQHYTLFPHLSVIENVEFGLKVRRAIRRDRRRRANETLDLVRIKHLANRRVHQLSGGEQQRVALARALTFGPDLLLLDEPLSALDAKLREELRAELFRLLHDLAITTIYITHDQSEAMSLGDELVVMNQGRLEQAGPPLDVYQRPANPFVASFLGSANVIEAECVVEDFRRLLKLPFTVMDAPGNILPGLYHAVIRPEDLELGPPLADQTPAIIESYLFLGHAMRVHARIHHRTVVIDVPNETSLQHNQPVSLRLKPAKIFLWRRDATPPPQAAR